MRYEKSCGAVVFKRDTDLKFLLLKHNNGGHWGLPKGHVEENETEHETAIREIKEETGLEVKIIYDGFRHEMEYSPFEGVMKKVVYFLAEVNDSEIKNQVEEIEECIWLDIYKAVDLVTYDNTKKLILSAYDYLTENKM